MESEICLITGITGQDGSFLAELLLEKGYKVFGLIRRLSSPNFNNIQHLVDNHSITLIGGDLADQSSIISAIQEAKPDEIYNLGAMSFVGESWRQAEYTSNITGLGALRVFEAVRQTNKNIKIYQASSSEQYGLSRAPQSEYTAMIPRSPYGVAKVFAHRMANVYRESYNMKIWCGILFNHESEKRGIEFVSQKIANGVAKIKLGLDKELKLGNLESKRDWGYSKDYVNGMWLMLNSTEKPRDYVLATGENHSVREFCEIAFDIVGLDWGDYVIIDKDFYRPAEIFELRGDYSRAKKELGWEPETKFNDLVKIMVQSELDRLSKKEV